MVVLHLRDSANDMGRLASYAILAGNLAFASWLIWLYLDYRISTRLFWVGTGLYVSLLVIGMVLYHVWANRAAARDDSRAFEVITHDEEEK